MSGPADIGGTSGAPTSGIGAVLLTDMVGSTEMRTRLGDVAADDVRRVHDGLLAATIDAHDGHVARWTGDGVKAVFPTASQAVAAALEMQRGVVGYGRRTDAVEPFRIRVGISAGEYTFDDGDYHGLAVIEAARLEALASPGEILASDMVRLLGQRRSEAAFDEVGEHHLKGLERPVLVHRVVDLVAPDTTLPYPRELSPDTRFPMVGRELEAARLARAWADVSLGVAKTVLVAAQPGMGKTRLIAECAREAHRDGAMVLVGGCDADLAVPYHPFAASLAGVRAFDDDLAIAIDERSGMLGPLFPGPRGATSDDETETSRYQLFEAVVALIERLSDLHPVVLVLEDLQWATPPTLLLLRHVVTRVRQHRLLLIGTYRHEEIGPTHPMRDVLAASHDTGADRLHLEPITVDDVASMMASRSSQPLSESAQAFAQRLHTESGGSPFFVAELLHHLDTTGDLDASSATSLDEVPLPESVRDVVAQRLGRLDTPVTELLLVAAVMGVGFDLMLLGAVTDRDLEDVLECIEAAERAALVREAAPGRYVFAHAIVRNALLEEWGATRRALWHRRIAEGLEQVRPDAFDELAHHWELAGERARSMDSLLAAADRDLAALAYESARDRYQAAVDHFSSAGAGHEASLGEAWLGLGLAHRSGGDLSYRDAVEQAGRLARRARRPDLMARAALASTRPGTWFREGGDLDLGLIELCEDALDHLDAADPMRVRILATLACNLTFDRDRARRAALVAEAGDLADRSGDAELVAAARNAEFLCLWDPSTLERRTAIARELGRLARATGDPEIEFLGGFFTAFCKAETASIDEARAQLGALGASISASRSFYFGFLARRLAVAFDIFACLPDAPARVDQLFEESSATQADSGGTWAIQQGGLARHTGTLGSLVAVMDTAADNHAAFPSWHLARGLALLDAGDLTSANRIVDQFSDISFDYVWMSSMQTLGDLAFGLGRGEVCREVHDALAPYAGRLGIISSGALCYGLISRSIGQAALGMGAADAAVRPLRDAVEQADTVEAPYEAVVARRLLAGALREADGSHGELVRVVGEASAIAERHGFAAEARLLASVVAP